MINSNKIKSKTEVLLISFGVEITFVRGDLNFFFANERVFRGGAYLSSGSSYPASYRNSEDPSSVIIDCIGFRVTLYLNS